MVVAAVGSIARRYGVVAATVALAAFLLFSYVGRAAVDIVFTDQYRLVATVVEPYFRGTLTLADLWRPYLESREFGYHLFFLGNAVVFGLNTLIESYAGALLLVVEVLVLWVAFRATAPRAAEPRAVAWGFVPVALVAVSLSQYDMLVWSIGVYLIAKSVLFVATFVLAERLLTRPTWSWPLALGVGAALFLGIDIIGASYHPAMVVALVFGLTLRARAADVGREQVRRVALLVGTCVGVASLIYYVDLGAGSGIMARVSYLVTHPYDAFKFGLYALSVSLTGSEFADKLLTPKPQVILGLAVAGLYLLATVVALRDGLAKRTTVPLMLMAYSLTMVALLTLGRVEAFGPVYGAQPRYIVDTNLGLIGLTWILVDALLRRREAAHAVPGPAVAALKGRALDHWLSLTLVPALALVIVCQVTNDVLEWRRAVDRRAYFERNRATAALLQRNPAGCRPDALAQMNAGSETELRTAVQILYARRLNLFRGLGGDRP